MWYSILGLYYPVSHFKSLDSFQMIMFTFVRIQST